MTLRRIVSRINRWWVARRFERRVPELAALRQAEAEHRRLHRPVKHIQKTRRALVHAALAAERKAS
jgi:hypothetical protein